MIFALCRNHEHKVTLYLTTSNLWKMEGWKAGSLAAPGSPVNERHTLVISGIWWPHLGWRLLKTFTNAPSMDYLYGFIFIFLLLFNYRCPHSLPPLLSPALPTLSFHFQSSSQLSLSRGPLYMFLDSDYPSSLFIVSKVLFSMTMT